ncbi:unnamed protein product [Ilex paraguariensis]|uniref:AT-hook motif nuclear-localized protein n=1 Tax=Ilex paraguariensis TaxID=185542 RepID=A0ABC8S0Y9_9AQUA
MAVGIEESPEENGDGGIVAEGGVNGVAECGEAVRRKTGILQRSLDFSASSEPAPKRGRGRPRGSGGIAVVTAGRNFTPHAMTVHTGEDIAQKILFFSQRCPHSISILSATGSVSRVDIHQPGSCGSILRYEGCFEILTLSGSHTYKEMGGVHHKIRSLSVSLANPDGRVFGGAIAGSFIADGPIQIILASFKQNMKQQLKLRQCMDSIATDMLCNADTVTAQAPKG